MYFPSSPLKLHLWSVFFFLTVHYVCVVIVISVDLRVDRAEGRVAFFGGTRRRWGDFRTVTRVRGRGGTGVKSTRVICSRWAPDRRWASSRRPGGGRNRFLARALRFSAVRTFRSHRLTVSQSATETVSGNSTTTTTTVSCPSQNTRTSENTSFPP